MANESGTAAVTGWLNTSIIDGLISWYLKEGLPAQKMVRMANIAPGTKTAAFSKVTKQSALGGTITELSGLSNTAFQVSNVTAAVAEVGILRQFTKLVERTNMLGPDGLKMAALQDGIFMCLEKLETDIWAEFANASTTVGTSGAAYTIANFAAAISQLTVNKADGPVVACLTTTQVTNLRAEVASSGAAHLAGGTGNGVLKPTGRDGFVDVFMGVPTYTSTLAATSGADKIGAHFVDGNANPSGAATGVAIGWMPEAVELSNPVFSGGTQMAVTMAYGMTEVLDGAYVGDVTVA